MESTVRSIGRFLANGVAVAVLIVLCACTTPARRAEDYVARDEWLNAVLEYRKMYASRPGDVEFKSRLKQTELKAADFYYQRGLHLLEQGLLDEAIAQFQEGLTAMPDHSKLQQAVRDVMARKQAAQMFEEAMAMRAAGRAEEARAVLERTLDVYPWFTEAANALGEIKAELEGQLSEGLALSSTAPVTLNFRQTDLKQAFEFLAKSFGVNVMFDDSVKSAPVTLFARDVSFDQGLKLLLATTKMFYKRIGPNTILVAPDTKEKRGQYEDHIVRTYQLNVVRAKEMADILKGLVNIKKISINEILNTIVIRDTEDVVRLSERIIDINDRKPAEIILDVEILEVNRNKSEKLGLDLGSYSVSAGLPPPGTVPWSGSLERTLEAEAVITLPTATFRLFKQDVDAQILANPKIRVTSGKSAKIHVGDRVPLRAASIVDATGQTRTTFDYKDIGIRLTVDPVVNLDNSAVVKLGLEVSSLGENLGTVNEPAFRIGTRNAETVMLLRDGETAILGGLIRDEERNTRMKVPGLGDIPIVGAIFTSFDDSAGRTDVLLTITPRVVRSWDIPPRPLREFYSGTENIYSDKPVFAPLETAPRSNGGNGNAQPEGQREDNGNGTAGEGARTGAASPDRDESGDEGSEATGPANTGQANTGQSNAGPASAGQAGANPPATGAGATAGADASSSDNAADAAENPAPTAPRTAQIGFLRPVYDVAAGQDVELEIQAENVPAGASLQFEVLYNGQLVQYVSGGKGEVEAASFNAAADSARGVITVSASLPTSVGVGQPATLARISVRGAKPGVSYLVFRTPGIRDSNGEAVSAQVRASRLVVK